MSVLEWINEVFGVVFPVCLSCSLCLQDWPGTSLSQCIEDTHYWTIDTPSCSHRTVARTMPAHVTQTSGSVFPLLKVEADSNRCPSRRAFVRRILRRSNKRGWWREVEEFECVIATASDVCVCNLTDQHCAKNERLCMADRYYIFCCITNPWFVVSCFMWFPCMRFSRIVLLSFTEPHNAPLFSLAFPLFCKP